MPPRGVRLGFVVAAAIALAVLLLVLSGLLRVDRPTATGSAASAAPASHAPASTAPSPVAPTEGSEGVAPQRVCIAEPGPLPSMLSSDPCPAAWFAIEQAVRPVGLEILREVVQPGPFYCDVIWPGVQTPVTCFGAMVRPGQYMHAWVSFRGSDQVAAVMLGLDLPDNLDQPGVTRPPWAATLVAVEVPPAGWVMP